LSLREATVAELLGTVARLQVHTAAVKANEVYDPAPLVAVDEASFDAGGMIGWDGVAWLLDNHHRSYPRGGSGAARAVSVGFSSHYSAMRKRFGATVVPGVAGENIIVETTEAVTLDRLGPGLEVRTPGGATLPLMGPQVAAPCREFTSYLLELPQRGTREDLAEDLAFLGEGMRGFVVGTATMKAPVVVTTGDPVYLSL